MLGWWITLYTHEPAAGQTQDNSSLIASWETGLGGLEWLEPLLDQGAAVRLSKSGYPNSYRIKACVLKEFLLQGPPQPRKGLAQWNQFHCERLSACPDQQWLWLEAWDQS